MGAAHSAVQEAAHPENGRPAAAEPVVTPLTEKALADLALEEELEGSSDDEAAGREVCVGLQRIGLSRAWQCAWEAADCGLGSGWGNAAEADLCAAPAAGAAAEWLEGEVQRRHP